MTAELSPTRRWQSLVPELKSLDFNGQVSESDASMTEAEKAAARAADTAERLLLLLHYSIDWEHSWIGEERHRKGYWDDILPGRVWHAARRAATLDQWWSNPALQNLGVEAPRYPDRRLELAVLLREPATPVLRTFRNSLPALLLRVRIIRDAVDAERKAKRE